MPCSVSIGEPSARKSRSDGFRMPGSTQCPSRPNRKSFSAQLFVCDGTLLKRVIFWANETAINARAQQEYEMWRGQETKDEQEEFECDSRNCVSRVLPRQRA